MRKSSITISNKLGLHARAASCFVKTAKQFNAEISVRTNDRKANGKSIMELMMLAAAQFHIVELIVNGPQEDAAFMELKHLIEDRFGEEE
ncbi:MAG: HPr family phosphocarrier protein [Candidatus Eutrophobiaceae bacterium]